MIDVFDVRHQIDLYRIAVEVRAFETANSVDLYLLSHGIVPPGWTHDPFDVYRPLERVSVV